MKRLLIFLLLCTCAFAQNDFTTDTDCVALWRMENGALTTDTIGGNTLTVIVTPTADTGDYKEGGASVDNDLNDGFYILDADLDADFPLKNGGSETNISTCFWCKFDTTNPVVWNKWDNGKNSISFVGSFSTVGFAMQIGYNGGASWENIEHATPMSTGIWYHVGCTFDNSDKSYRIRVWDDNASTILGSDKTGTATNNINVEDGFVVIGDTWGGAPLLDGQLDEIVVFKDILTADEIDQIRGGTFGASAGQLIIISKTLDMELQMFFNDFTNGRWDAQG
jgi:hypothetical protein